MFQPIKDNATIRNTIKLLGTNEDKLARTDYQLPGSGTQRKYRENVKTSSKL